MENLAKISAIVGGLACIVIPASWRIAAKAGYDPKLALLMIVSPINLVLLLLFAGSEWPIERRLRESGSGS
jgi:hypothetical protein